MPKFLQFEMILLAISLLIIIIYIVRSEKISIKYSMVWLFSGLLILFFALFPNLMQSISKLIGFEILSNMVFLIFFSILFLITISLTIIVTHQKAQIQLLIQELSILKSNIGENQRK